MNNLARQFCRLFSVDNNTFVPSSACTGKTKDKRIVPLSYRLIGLGLNAVSRINNDWAAEQLSRVWFRVFKSKIKPRALKFWDSADNCIEVSLQDKSIPVYLWGKGPMVVFMHGWSGSGTQFRHFVPALVASGFQVALFDAPAHGQNVGSQSHLLEFTDSLVAIQDQIGPVHCVVAHSLGAMATTLATHRGLNLNQMVLLAPHLDVNEMFESYSGLLMLNKNLANSFRQKLDDKMSIIMQRDNVWELLQPQILIGDKQLDGLLVYDENDEEVPLDHFEQVQQQWVQAESHRTCKLGHVRLLKDQTVIKRVAEYLQKA